MHVKFEVRTFNRFKLVWLTNDRSAARAHTHTHTHTHWTKTVSPRHSLRSLGGDNNNAVANWMTSYGGHSREHKFWLWKNLSVWLVKTEYGKRPDGVTLLPWARRKPLAWDITVPDTYADLHLANTATMAGAVADKAASTKEAKYRQLANSHVVVPVATETAGTWNHLVAELTHELDRRTTAVTDDDPRKTGFLFQRLSVALQRGNAVSFRSTFTTE